jgi:hypothetical protein
LEVVSEGPKLEECSEEKSAREAVKKYALVMEHFLSGTWYYGCPLPCRRTTYEAK